MSTCHRIVYISSNKINNSHSRSKGTRHHFRVTGPCCITNGRCRSNTLLIECAFKIPAHHGPIAKKGGWLPAALREGNVEGRAVRPVPPDCHQLLRLAS